MTTTSYDNVLYPSYTHPQTHPDRLATLATLFGLRPAPVATSRMLELACGQGGNLIPLAVSYPDSHCVGVDLSQRQIDSGQAVIEALGLTNIDLRPQSILDFPVDSGPFDYIIAHGVYSWVPEPVRDKILQICRDHLAPQGVAIVSYNTFPGWHQRRMIRDMMLFHETLTSAFIFGAVELHASEPTFVVGVSERPKACPLARHQATTSDHVTNRRHSAIPLDPISRWLLTRLDGSADSDQLLDQLVEFVQKENITFQIDGRVLKNVNEIREHAAQHLVSCLQHLGRNALLIP